MDNDFINNLVDFIGKHEGCKLKPYKCTSNKTTIGYGRNLDDRGITQKEAKYLLINDIESCIEDLNKNLYWWILHPVIVQKILVDMCFNLGINGLLEFKNSLSLIQNKQYLKASKELLKSKWASQVGNRATEISSLLATIE